MKHDREANKRNAIDFYRTAYRGDPAKAVELYVGADYIQHNPLVSDGKEAFVEYLAASNSKCTRARRTERTL